MYIIWWIKCLNENNIYNPINKVDIMKNIAIGLFPRGKHIAGKNKKNNGIKE